MLISKFFVKVIIHFNLGSPEKLFNLCKKDTLPLNFQNTLDNYTMVLNNLKLERVPSHCNRHEIC